MDKSLLARWQNIFGTNEGNPKDRTADSNHFAPFASELDWKIAQWAVKDGIGHNSFDRLLNIPGVRLTFFLILMLIPNRCERSLAFLSRTYGACTRRSTTFLLALEAGRSNG